MKVKEWEIAAAKLTSKQRMEMIKAIKTITSWDDFYREYAWTSLVEIQTILEIAEREAPK
jgi:hypothetical protein